MEFEDLNVCTRFPVRLNCTEQEARACMVQIFRNNQDALQEFAEKHRCTTPVLYPQLINL